MMKIAIFAAAAFGTSAVLADSSRVQFLIQQGIESAVEAEVDAEMKNLALGIQNCQNKCQNLFNNQQYAINTQQFTDTFEYDACMAGCNICNSILTNNDPGTGKCFTICKNTNWLDNKDSTGNPFPITKGIIEPDKACMYGCVINTCQFVCQGGTTDMTPNAQNANSWWQDDATKGCSIKTGAIRPGGYYSQNSAYNFYNNPSGAGGADSCCANAYSLCKYNGDKSSTNYQDVIGMAQVACASVPSAGKSVKSICKYFLQPGNCGNALS